MHRITTWFSLKNSKETLRIAQEQLPDLILLDVIMAGMTGFETCRKLKANYRTRSIPVIFVTALYDDQDEAQGFEVGGVDYITTPISPPAVLTRVKNHLSLVQADELKRTRLQIAQRLGRAAEYKDNVTSLQVLRMSHYSRILGQAYGFSADKAKILLHAAPMHDIGEIGIPDQIMLKPGKLTAEEFANMRSHPQISAEIIGDVDSELLELAKSVALTHHEKWNGSGYSNGLAGESIPLQGRIVALADVFDAITSKRPYKEAWTVEATMSYIKEQSGKHFDPRLVELLEQNLPAVLQVKARWQDH